VEINLREYNNVLQVIRFGGDIKKKLWRMVPELTNELTEKYKKFYYSL